MPGESIHILIDDQYLKMAKVGKLAGRKVVQKLYYREVSGLTLEGVSREILAGLRQLRSASRHISVVLPTRLVITKNIEVPSLDDDEIQSIVRLQAVRHTPYSKEEVTVGHLNLEVLLGRYTKALLVIGSNENIRKKTSVIQLVGQEIDSVHLSFEILARAIDEYLIGADFATPYGCIFYDNDSTDFIAVQKHMPFFIRSIPIGARTLKVDRAGNMKKLEGELHKTLDAYQDENQGVPIKECFVLGIESADREELLKNLQTTFKIPLKSVSLEDRLNLSPESRETIANFKQGTLLDVMLDGLVYDRLRVELMPEDLKLKKSFRSRARDMFMSGVFMLAIFAFIVGIFLVQILFRLNGLRELRTTYDTKQQEAESLVVLSDDTKAMRNFIKRRGVALGSFDDLQKILPKEMYLQEISLNDEGKMSMKGTSELMSMVFSFVTEMENHPRFMNVTSDYTKSRKEGDRDVSDFGISCSLEDGGTSDGR